MKKLFIFLSFALITTSINSQGRYRALKKSAEILIDAVDLMSTSYDIYQYLSPKKPSPNNIKDYYEGNALSEIRNIDLKLPNVVSISYTDLFEDNSKKLAIDYRKWANSTPELSRKYGKTSKYDLDRQTNGEPNNSHFQRSYAAGKVEFHKIHPISKYGQMAIPLTEYSYKMDNSSTFFGQEAQKIRQTLLKSDTVQKYKYLPTDKKNAFLDDDLLFSKSINNSVENKWTRKYGEQPVGKNERSNYESYLDQKLNESISEELINFNREINSIVIKSKNIDLKNEYIKKPY